MKTNKTNQKFEHKEKIKKFREKRWRNENNGAFSKTVEKNKNKMGLRHRSNGLTVMILAIGSRSYAKNKRSMISSKNRNTHIEINRR